ncbi:ABC transporter ATP-binding protein [Vulgatibacter incomptus]|uniref:ATP-binding protein of ABC transporter n=1 Tax=Vulgatibacter incomptus TaxID=1391653 RepID=A0A0K1PES8_9BACT|nr:ABC transporter ATP-binding protein [Vulgatibacter incomptus]AKU92038.1 ATP-binding protein of ABC transporter [Vulgatibacter incomptus]
MFRHLRDTFAQAPRTLALVWSASRRLTLVLGSVTVAASLLPLLVAYVGKRIIDAVVAASPAEALRWVLLELAVIAVQALAQRGLSLLRSILGARLSLDVNLRILEKAQTLELRHFEDPTFYDQLTKARREASSRPISVVTELFQLFQNTLTLAGYAVLLLQFSGLAVLGLLIATVPATVAEMRFSGLAFRLRNWRAPEGRKLNYLEHVLANDGHAKEVQLFGLGPLFLSRYRQLGETLYREDTALARRRAGWAYVLSLLGTGAFYACYAILALSAAKGAITLGELTLYVVAFRQGQQAFQSILTAVGGMYEDNLYMSNLFQFLAIPTRRAESPKSLQARAELGIRFDDVGFRYPGQERFALRHIDLFIPAGQSLALVGENGAGKTTFIKLLSRLYEPTEGRILLDGKPLDAWEPGALRNRIGVIFQDFNRYQLTVRENVGMGSVDHLREDLRIERAIERGGASDVISAFEGGLETQLGRWFHSGAELSGGQWQKLALARAFMREEADILILDEPTAALDARAEAAVFERFRALAEGRTTIVISHRFPTVRAADRIVVIEDGRIVEQGSHDELVAADTRYARLFELQASGYR